MRLKWYDRRPARRVLSLGQAAVLLLFVAGIAAGAERNPHLAIISLIAAAMAFWVAFVSFRLALWIAGSKYRPPHSGLIGVSSNLPSYTVFVPLHREGKMLPRLIKSLDSLQYPKDKLQILFLLEEDDGETWSALEYIELPRHFELVKVPGGGPRTKPNALNVGLARATGTYCVIYDAEDRPEPDQLLQAVATFKDASRDVVCLQARLAFWNGTSNWMTRFYWAEYITHFEWTSAGLAYFGIVPPLGGTSNHFITEYLREMAIDPEYLPFSDGYVGGWDPFNVTEDAELSAALAAYGHQVQMLDSVTWEEATARLKIADRQRRRWLKGYALTGLMYTRRPIRTARKMGLKNWFFFNLLMLGTPISLLLNPLFWGATVVYFATRTTVIEQLFPLPLYYLGLLLMVIGNLVLFYQMVAACLKRGGYANVKFMLFLPAWWLFTSWSAYAMVFELAFRPHHWHKTEHGHDLEKEELLGRENIA